MKSSGDGKTVVVVGTVTDDVRIFDIPALKVMYYKHQGRSLNYLAASYLEGMLVAYTLKKARFFVIVCLKSKNKTAKIN